MQLVLMTGNTHNGAPSYEGYLSGRHRLYWDRWERGVLLALQNGFVFRPECPSYLCRVPGRAKKTGPVCKVGVTALQLRLHGLDDYPRFVSSSILPV